MGSSGSRAGQSVPAGIKAEYDASLALFNSGEQTDLQESFEAVCSTVTEPETKTQSRPHGFSLLQLEVLHYVTVPNLSLIRPMGCRPVYFCGCTVHSLILHYAIV